MVYVCCHVVVVAMLEVGPRALPASQPGPQGQQAQHLLAELTCQ